MPVASDPLPPWSVLHDLVLIHLALMHGAEDDVDVVGEPAAGPQDVQQVLARRYPQVGAGHMEQAMHDALFVYIGQGGRQMLEIAVASLREAFGREQRIAVLDDLASVVSADGVVLPAELSFLQQLAREWDVEADLQR